MRASGTRYATVLGEPPQRQRQDHTAERIPGEGSQLETHRFYLSDSGADVISPGGTWPCRVTDCVLRCVADEARRASVSV